MRLLCTDELCLYMYRLLESRLKRSRLTDMYCVAAVRARWYEECGPYSRISHVVCGIGRQDNSWLAQMLHVLHCDTLLNPIHQKTALRGGKYPSRPRVHRGYDRMHCVPFPRMILDLQLAQRLPFVREECEASHWLAEANNVTRVEYTMLVPRQ